MGEVLRNTWTLITNNLGQILLLGLIVLGISLAAYAAVLALFFAAAALPLFFPIAILAVVGLAVILGPWIYAGTMIFCLRLARGQEAPLDAVFSGGPYLLRVLGVSIVLWLIGLGTAIVLTGPGALLGDQAMTTIGQALNGLASAVIYVIFLAAPLLIVDHDLGVTESLQASIDVMKGNLLTGFLIFLVVGILAVIAVLLTCGIAILLVIPFYLLLPTVIYLSATGQEIAT